VALVAIIVLLQASILDFMQMHFDAD
jgi:hypothetical protein